MSKLNNSPRSFRLAVLSSAVMLACGHTLPAYAVGELLTVEPPVGETWNSTSIYDVSADGNVVVGNRYDGSDTQAFQWTENDGVVYIPGGDFSNLTPRGVSADGSVIVGLGSDSISGGTRAFRWTSGTGAVSLGTLGGIVSYAYGVSGDGSTVVGMSYDASSASRAFRWTQADGMVDLGTLPGASNAYAMGVSADGLVVVGHSDYHAFRWTSGLGMVGLGSLDGASESEANAASADGSVIVGYSQGSANYGYEAFRWTEAGGMVGLGVLFEGTSLAGVGSEALDVSADGLVVVGLDSYLACLNCTAQQRGFRWTAATGMQTIGEWLNDNGATVPDSVAGRAYATNADGSVVIGRVASGYTSTYGDVFIARVLGSGGTDPGGTWTATTGIEGAGNYNFFWNISGDGNVAVGNSNGGPAITWSSGSISQLQTSSGEVSHAYAANHDGTVAVGYTTNGAGPLQAIRWVNGTMDLFLNDSANQSFANDVSADGSLIVGTEYLPSSTAYRWTASGKINLPSLGGSTQAYKVSADGTIAVGSSFDTNSTKTHAVRWLAVNTVSPTVEDLGVLAGDDSSFATAISADGTVIAGNSYDSTIGQSTTQEGFVWKSGVMTELPSLNAFETTIRDASADGRVIVGYDSTDGTPSTWQAMRWVDAGSGYTQESVVDWLANNGVTVDWQQLTEAHGVSDDGTVIVGNGQDASGNWQGYIARVVDTGGTDTGGTDAGGTDTGGTDTGGTDTGGTDTGGTDTGGTDTGGEFYGLGDLSESVGDLNKGRALGHKISNMSGDVISNFASFRPGMVSDYLHDKTLFSPVVAYGSGSHMYMGGIAAEHVSKGASFKVFLAAVDAEDDGRYNGDLELSGTAIGAAVVLLPAQLTENGSFDPLSVMVGFTRGFYDGDFDRSYLNGTEVQVSNGEPDVDAQSAFIKAGWDVKLSSGNTITPYAKIAYNKTEIDSYTEQGGSLPGRVSAQDESNVEYSIGIASGWQVNDRFSVNADAALVHLRDDEGPALSVDTDLGVITYPGVKYDDSWGEFSLNAQWKINQKLQLGAGVRATVGSDYPEDYSARLELNYEL